MLFGTGLIFASALRMDMVSSLTRPPRLAPAASAEGLASVSLQPLATPLPPPPAPSWRSQREHERYLGQLWERVTGGEPIGLDDDLFAHGASDPLLAARLLAEIERATTHHLSLATLQAAPTLRELAAVLDAAGWDWPVPLVQLRPGTGRPLFFMHSLAGTFLELWAVLRALETPRPVLGLQARGLAVGQVPHLSIPEMAREYILHMRRIQPSGPYSVAGYSIGGVIAFEVAQQLVRDGEQVDLLCLIDSHAHGRYQPLPQWWQQRIARSLVALGKLRALPPRGKLVYVGKKVLVLFDRLRVRCGLAPRWPELVGDVVREAHFPPASRRTRGAMLFAFREYRPLPYPGKLLYVRAALQGRVDPLPFWRTVASGGIEEVITPGDHDEMVTGEHARALARILARHL
jgi:acetoacetyl-CoA synthetase